MAQFIAFKLIPIFAALWIAGGGLIVGIEIISAVRALTAGKPIRAELNAALGAIGIVLLVLGLAFRAISKQQDRGPELVLLLFGGVSLLGGVVTLFLLWSELRRQT